MKSKIYKFDMGLYPFPLLVSKDFDYHEIENIFWRVTSTTDVTEFGEDELKPKPTEYAKTIMVVSKKTEELFFLVLIYNKEISVGVAAHEAGHISTLLGMWLGFALREHLNDEPYAYIDEWCADRIYSVAKNKYKNFEFKTFNNK